MWCYGVVVLPAQHGATCFVAAAHGGHRWMGEALRRLGHTAACQHGTQRGGQHFQQHDRGECRRLARRRRGRTGGARGGPALGDERRRCALPVVASAAVAGCLLHGHSCGRAQRQRGRAASCGGCGAEPSNVTSGGHRHESAGPGIAFPHQPAARGGAPDAFLPAPGGAFLDAGHRFHDHGAHGFGRVRRQRRAFVAGRRQRRGVDSGARLLAAEHPESPAGNQQVADE
mmetsp:Transcript_40218/g.129176  ORF Transcript_40218/g.129176 Transcript_40218/m.129176 type:complete len:229 (-) Transcript_40218:1802-2488(-)